MLGPTAGRPWCQASIWGSRSVSLLLSDSFAFVDVGRPLWREDGSVVYNWHSPAQSFSIPILQELMTIFYSPRFDTPSTLKSSPRIYIPQQLGGPVIPPATDTVFQWLLLTVLHIYIGTVRTLNTAPLFLSPTVTGKTCLSASCFFRVRCLATGLRATIY
jgi:hypothetical protein